MMFTNRRLHPRHEDVAGEVIMRDDELPADDVSDDSDEENSFLRSYKLSLSGRILKEDYIPIRCGVGFPCGAVPVDRNGGFAIQFQHVSRKQRNHTDQLHPFFDQIYPVFSTPFDSKSHRFTTLIPKNTTLYEYLEAMKENFMQHHDKDIIDGSVIWRNGVMYTADRDWDKPPVRLGTVQEYVFLFSIPRLNPLEKKLLSFIC
jgi:hypothetical protein